MTAKCSLITARYFQSEAAANGASSAKASAQRQKESASGGKAPTSARAITALPAHRSGGRISSAAVEVRRIIRPRSYAPEGRSPTAIGDECYGGFRTRDR